MADNILDDVDEILGAESLEDDKSFNESELQDIMSEIEDLEKEFVEVDETPVAPISLQDQIDAELNSELEEIADAEIITEEEISVMDEMIEAPTAEILAFEKVAPTPVQPVQVAAPVSNSEVAFAARGQMSLNLDFMVGSETAKLSIDPVKGLVVTLSGVELCISEDSGCTVSMDNGMKFTIPLSSPTLSTKKKSA